MDPSEAPFRIELVCVTGLTISSTFPLALARTAAIGYVEDHEGVPLSSARDRIGLRTVMLRFYSEILAESKPVELLDDQGVAWVVPPDRVLAIRVIDPLRTPGPPGEHEVRHIGFQLRRPAVAAERREPPTVPPAPPSGRPGSVAVRPKNEHD